MKLNGVFALWFDQVDSFRVYIFSSKNYLEESYNRYLGKGTDYTSKVDFSASQNNSKKGQSLSQFTNPTVDKYEKK